MCLICDTFPKNMNRLDTLNQLLKKDPKSSFLLFAIAKEYETLNDYQSAVKFYKELSINDPDYTGCYYHFDKALFKLQYKKEGMEIIDNGLVICTKNNQLHDLSELKNLKMNLLIEDYD